MALETVLVCQFAFVVSFIACLQAQPYIQPPIVPVNNRYIGSPLGEIHTVDQLVFTLKVYLSKNSDTDCIPGVYGGVSDGSYPPTGLPYGGNTYPGNYAAGGYGPTLTTAGYGPNTAKPSYAYFTGYGNQNALSGYEGPYGGVNTYWQPGVSYPPQGYGAYGSSYNQGQQGYGSSSSCRDKTPDCAMRASTGQCANSLSTRNLCPISCGTGCTDTGEYSAGSTYGSGLAGSVYSTYPYSPVAGNTPIGYNGYSGNNYGLDTLLNGYQPSISTLLPTSYGLPSPSNYELPPFYGPEGYFPICKDSHIQGCKNWANIGFCQTVPDFMLSYCKASCGVCDDLGGGNYRPYYQPSFGPLELNGDEYSQVFGNGLVNNLYSTDLLNRPIDDFSLASSLSPAAASYYADLLANNPNYQLTSNDLLNSLNEADQIGQGIGFGGVNSGFVPGLSSSQFLPYNSGLYPYKSSIFSAQKKEPKAMAMASNDAGISGGFGLSNSIDKSGSNGQLSTVVRMDELAGA